MNIEEFLSRLNGVTPDGRGGWMACCPAHDDRNPSMHVTRGNDGRVLVKCFAGCTTEEIVSAMGLTVRDLMADAAGGGGTPPLPARGRRGGSGAARAGGEKKKRDFGRLVCEYVYKNEDGAAVYKVQRRVMANGRKTFIQMCSDPTAAGGWAFGVAKNGVTYIPYRLPEVRAAAAAGHGVVICEGEKDVETFVSRLHGTATCNPKGAGKWQTGWGKHFEGVRSILIIADKDPETTTDRKTGEKKRFAVGQRHACDVERKLRADGFAGKIRKIVMPDVEVEQGCLKRVKDFTDWAEAMDMAGRPVDMAAFKKVIDNAEWPSAWEFAEDALEGLTEAQGEARRAAAAGAGATPPPGVIADDCAAVRAGGSGADDADAPGEDGRGGCGRFGRLSPRPPADCAVRLYQVDYRLSASLTARFEIGVGHYRFQGWTRSNGDEQVGGETVGKGRYFLASDNKPVALSLSSMFAMAFGNVARFGALDMRFKFGPRQVSEIQAKITLLWLRSRGKFFWDNGAKGFATSLFFDEVRGVLMRVRSDEFLAFVATESEINREASAFDFIMSLIDDAAISEAVSQGVSPSVMWDRRGDAVFVSSGDAEMYRIRDGRIDKVQNGTDGVVFMRGKTLMPWTLCDGPGIDPFEKALIFDKASWASPAGRMSVRLWVLNLFASHETKPILLLTGAIQTGKTRMARCIKEILGVLADGQLDQSVQTIEDGERGLDSFWTTVNNGKIEVYDNFDTRVKWASDTLQTVATGGQTKRRTLYTTFGVSVLRANAHLIITSNNPLFTTEGSGGLADRLVSVHLNSSREKQLDKELSDDIREHRDEFMTWMVRVVAAALADHGEVSDAVNKRHPDYGRFSVRCGRAFGDEAGVIAALGSAEADKSLLPLQNDSVTKEILEVLARQEPPYVMRFTAGEMTNAILARLGNDEIDERSRQIYGSRRIGRAISEYWRQFSVIFNVDEPRILEGRTLYNFYGLTQQGDDAISAASAVGSVGFNAIFTKTSYRGAHTREVFEKRANNPPNPPNAPAPINSPSLSSQEEEKKEEESENESWWM